MRDQHQRPGVFDQALFQNLQCGDIQVVGRLVQQEKVRRLKHQLCDQHAGPFTPGKPANPLVQTFRRKKKSFGPRSDVDDAILINHRVAVRGKRPAQSHIGIEFAILVEVHNSQSLGAANFA